MNSETFLPEKKKKGCSSCKKKAPITKLADPIETEFIPTLAEIRLAYSELGSKEFTSEKKEFINKVYNFLFQEDFDFGCSSCANTQVRKFKYYIEEKLNIK